MRYSRQENLKSFGEVAQDRLKKSRVIVFGAGGLGCPLLLYLNSMGVGFITIVDGDLIEASNLNRQILFGPNDIGMPKAEIARTQLQRLNPENCIVAQSRNILSSDFEEWVAIARNSDLLIDCTDNLEARYTINKIAQTVGIFCVSASIYTNEGLIGSYSRGSCLECYFPNTTDFASAFSCSENGVLGAHVGTLGCLQATEVVNILTNRKSNLFSKMVHIDFEKNKTEELTFKKNEYCPLCFPKSGKRKLPKGLELEIDSGEFLSILSSVRSVGLIMIYPEGFQSETKFSEFNGTKTLHTSLSLLDKLSLDRETTWICICDIGSRSLIAAKILRSFGLEAFSLAKGKKSLLSKS